MSGFDLSLANSRSLRRKAADPQSRYYRSTQPNPNYVSSACGFAKGVRLSRPIDKLAQMTIEGDMHLHEQIIAGRADVAVLR